jgi:hypothetical protein
VHVSHSFFSLSLSHTHTHTAPYLRIPLILAFFSKPERINALGSEDLRNVLDCVMFEPGAWQAEASKPIPAVVPAADREHLATPVGLLFNELMFSSVGILKPIQDMLELVLDLDTGKYVHSTAVIILYVVRLVVRVEAYMLYLIEHHKWVRYCCHVGSCKCVVFTWLCATSIQITHLPPFSLSLFLSLAVCVCVCYRTTTPTKSTVPALPPSSGVFCVAVRPSTT